MRKISWYCQVMKVTEYACMKTIAKELKMNTFLDSEAKC